MYTLNSFGRRIRIYFHKSIENVFKMALIKGKEYINLATWEQIDKGVAYLNIELEFSDKL